MNPRLGTILPPLALITVLMSMALFTTGCPTDELSDEPPEVVLDVRSEETYVVGLDVIQISVTARDSQGGALQFRMVDKPERAQFQVFKNSALFTWDPIPSDVTGDQPRRLIFAVTNSSGLTTERVVSVRILAGNGVPRFLNSASELYDPASQQPLVIAVRVRDDSSSSMNIFMGDAPEGATFHQPQGTSEGTFTWMPNPVQLTRRVHSATFVADNGSSVVEHKVAIIIKQKDSGSGGIDTGSDRCTAEELIQHIALGPQRGVRGYDVEARLVGAAATKYSSMFVYWTAGDPLNGSGGFEAIEMQPEDGAVFRAEIPNQLLSSGSSKDIFYTICAYDDRADDDDDLAVVCAPTSITYSFVAYSPDDAGCIDDGISNDTAQTASEVSDQAWEFYRVCSASPDFHSLSVYGGEKIDIFVLYSFGQGVTVQLLDEDMNEVALHTSSCAGYASASFEAPEGAGLQTYYFKVSGDDASYQISAFVESGGQCPGSHIEPNNTPAQATLVVEDTTYQGLSICTAEDLDIFTVELIKGDLFAADLYFEHAQGDLDMILFAPSQAATITTGQGDGVERAWSEDDNESLIYSAVESGFYYLSVYTETDPNTYDLEISIACSDEDAFAGNHTLGQAALVALDEHEDLKLCAGQADWFRRQGFAGTTLVGELRVQYGGRLSDVTLEVYDANGTRLAQATQGTNFLDIEFEPTQSGQYYFKVQSTRKMLYSFTLLQFD